jgi:hypothetical protein
MNLMPEVIGIGTRRCASSWLHKAMNMHPEIDKPVKGLHYFSTNWDKGIEWYLSEFENNDKTLVEYSVSYSYPEYYTKVASRITELMPSAKIFIVVRNPVERAFSDYRRSVQRLEIPKETSFEDALKIYPIFLQRGEYGKIISEYLKYFSPEQILVLDYEDIIFDPVIFLKTLFAFIGVSTIVNNEMLQKNDMSPKVIRFKLYSKVIQKAKNIFEYIFVKIIGADAWNNFCSEHMKFYHRILSLNSKSTSISTELRNQTLKYYHDDIYILEKITNKSYKHWK